MSIPHDVIRSILLYVDFNEISKVASATNIMLSEYWWSQYFFRLIPPECRCLFPNVIDRDYMKAYGRIIVNRIKREGFAFLQLEARLCSFDLTNTFNDGSLIVINLMGANSLDEMFNIVETKLSRSYGIIWRLEIDIFSDPHPQVGITPKYIEWQHSDAGVYMQETSGMMATLPREDFYDYLRFFIRRDLPSKAMSQRFQEWVGGTLFMSICKVEIQRHKPEAERWHRETIAQWSVNDFN